MHYQKMSVKDWIAVESNPIQRDTERHLARAKHLMTPFPSHAFVFAAQLPNTQLIKLDGHTRALAWERGMVPAPDSLLVGIIPVKDRKEAEVIYKTFDSKVALETTKDRVSGAFNRYNFHPVSALLQSGNVVTGLRMAYSVMIGGTIKMAGAGSASNAKDHRSPKQAATMNADEYMLINEFSPELMVLDAFGLRQGQITSGLIGAFILSYRKYGHKVTPFWQGVFSNEGSKISGQMDAIQAVCELSLARRKTGGAMSKMASFDTAGRTLMAIEKWLKDETMFQIPRPLDTTGYLSGHEKPAERLIKKADIGKTKAA